MSLPPPGGGDRPEGIEFLAISIGPAGNATGAAPQTTQPIPFTPLPTVNSSSVYRIAADGSPEELWSARDDVVYSMGLLPGGKLLLGTGNDGVVLELDGNHVFSKLVKATSRQVTSIAAGPGGKLFLAAANPGKVFALGPENESEGTYESQPLDAHIFSRWGRTVWWGENFAAANAAGAARIAIYARSGNTSDPDSNLSDWSGPYANPSGDKLDCPAARFVQWKAVLRGGSGASAPAIDWFSIAYLPKNIPPEVTAIAVQDPGVRIQGISLPPAGAGPQAPRATGCRRRRPRPRSNQWRVCARGRFLDDEARPSALRISIPFLRASRKKDSSPFCGRPMMRTMTSLNSPFISGAKTRLPGSCSRTSWIRGSIRGTQRQCPTAPTTLKIVANDAPSNPGGEALSSERESDRFVVDNAPPSIAQLTAESVSAGVRVRFQASAPVSFVARAQYSLDAGDWTLDFPAGGLSDAPRENYDFQLQKISPGEHTVTVRVYDQFENVSSAKATVRIATSGN